MVIGTTFLIVAAVIIIIWVVIEMKRMKHKVFAIFLIALILFGYISTMFVFKGQDIDYKSIDGLKKASSLYFVWLGSVFTNVKSITSNAIKMDWGTDKTPQNITNG